MPARKKATTQRARVAPKLYPLPVRPLPRGAGQIRKSTRDWWATWWTSGRAGLLDDRGIAQLERLVPMVDELARVDGDPVLRLKLSTEVRRQEASLLRGAAEPAHDDARRGSPRERMLAFRQRRVARTTAVLRGLDHAVWPSYSPGLTDNVVAGFYELHCDPQHEDLTPAQAAEVERWHAKNECNAETIPGGTR